MSTPPSLSPSPPLYRKQDGNTPLHYACLSDNPEVALFLLRKAACTSAGRGGGGGGDAGFSNGGRNSGGNSDSGGGGSQQPKRRQRFLLESRNSAFETPLLRAAVGGSVAVAQALMVRARAFAHRATRAR